MLTKILSKNDCAKCKFCCSFRRQSLWETPVFDEETKFKLEKEYPQAKFIKRNDFYTINLSENYKTDNPEEEAACPFLKDGTGCTLNNDDKPFDCKIWPLRIIKSQNNELKIVLTPTCQAINKISLETVKDFVNSDLKEKIFDYAKNHPEIIKDDSDFFTKLD